MNDDDNITNDMKIKNERMDLEKSLREKLKAKAKLLQEARKTNNVRIDNFQRPFSLQQLIEFLEENLQFKINEQNLWLNSIKTHCYITFDNDVDATTCINNIKGKRFPSTNSTELTADFTKVSVQEAPSSREAYEMPGNWKNLKEEVNVIRKTKYRYYHFTIIIYITLLSLLSLIDLH